MFFFFLQYIKNIQQVNVYIPSLIRPMVLRSTSSPLSPNLFIAFPILASNSNFAIIGALLNSDSTKSVQSLGRCCGACCFSSNAKGQLISEGNFGVFKSHKKQTKFFEGFLPQSLKWVNQRNKDNLITNYHDNVPLFFSFDPFQRLVQKLGQFVCWFFCKI